MPDYVDKLLFAINNYDSSDIHSVNALRDLVCWISDNEELKKRQSRCGVVIYCLTKDACIRI